MEIPIKKIAIAIFVVVFVVVAFFITKSVFSTVYHNQVQQTLETGSQTSSEQISEKAFSCKSTEKKVAYVYLHGFGDHNVGAFDYQRSLIGDKPILDFDYDETLSLQAISADFVQQFNTFAMQQDVHEIVIIGQSAGGVIASYAASQLEFAGSVELHTLASPLNGYHVPEAFAGEQIGFGREMTLGFASFATPLENFAVYHHKTIVDEELEAYCGDYKAFCDSQKIQDNNLASSLEFFYDHTHASIMHPVSKLIIDCHS